MSQELSESARLPSVPEVVQILEMCEAHDLPIDQLPGLWDKYQALEQVERRINIQNGNMDREIIRLRGLTASQDKDLRDERLNNSALESNAEMLKLRIIELEALLADAKRVAAGLDDDKARLAAQLSDTQTLVDGINTGADCLRDKYEALLCRCKHFESLADQERIDNLEDLLAHYKAGMAGMKDLIRIPWFSNEFRLELVRRALYVFEPELKRVDCSGAQHDA